MREKQILHDHVQKYKLVHFQWIPGPPFGLVDRVHFLCFFPTTFSKPLYFNVCSDLVSERIIISSPNRTKCRGVPRQFLAVRTKSVRDEVSAFRDDTSAVYTRFQGGFVFCSFFAFWTVKGLSNQNINSRLNLNLAQPKNQNCLRMFS